MAPLTTAAGQVFLYLPLDLLYHGTPRGVPAQYQGLDSVGVDLLEVRDDISKAM